MAGPRMILLVLCPGATLMSFIGAYFQGLLVLGITALNRNPTSWRFSIAVATQVHAPRSSDAIHQNMNLYIKEDTTTSDEPSLVASKLLTLRINGTTNASGTEFTTCSQVISLADVPLEWHADEWIKRKTLPNARCCYSYLLDIARATVILAVLGKAVSSIVLVVRRAQVPGATLLLDSTNGLYSVIGVLTALNSLVLMMVDDKWEVMPDAPLKKLHGDKENGCVMGMALDLVYELPPTSFLMDVAMGLTYGMLPMSFLRSQCLLSRNEIRGFLPSKLRSSCSNPPLPTFIAHILMMLTMVVWVSIKALPPLYEGWKRSSHKIYDVLCSLLRVLGACFFGLVVSIFFSYWIAQIYELIVIARGTEVAVWGVDLWRWYDPWSDILFVY